MALDRATVAHIAILARIRLPEAELEPVAAELSQLHRRGVAHRDLRTDNVIVAPDGAVELVDFDRAVVGGTRSAAAPSR